MRQVSAALQTLLYGQAQHLRANLYVFVLPNQTIYLTDAEQDLTVTASASDGTSNIWTGAKTFSHVGQVIRRTRSRISSDGSVDDAEVYIEGAGITTLGNNLGCPLSALSGLFDGVRCCVLKAFFDAASYGSTVNGVILDVDGFCYPADFSSTSLRLQVKSHLALLDVPVPSRLMQPACPYRFGEAACGVAVPVDNLTAAAGCTTSSIVTTVASTHANGIGWVAVTGGAQKGLLRAIKSISGTTITLVTALPAPLSAGDTVAVSPGCDKTRNGTYGCTVWQGNPPTNFGGFPDVPGSTAVAATKVA